MKLFECQACGHVVYFENSQCVRCGHALGFLTDSASLSALAPANGQWRPLAAPERLVRYCANAAHGVCNWLVPADEAATLCRACDLNRTIPDLSVPGNVERWRRIELAKHRVIYAVLRWGLPLMPLREEGDWGLGFDFVAEGVTAFGAEPLRTGHDAGLITLSIAEADDAERERRRSEMAEPYRTVIGHLRHEIGHYYEQLLVVNERLEPCRQLFGDERADYAAALARYYAEGPAPDWQARCVSAYASAHPWEDFAETWSHYLHMVDALETAAYFGIRVAPKVGTDPALAAWADVDSYAPVPFQRLLDAWLPLTYAMNAINRSVGQPDFYPFVLPPPALDKLRFVHRLVHGEPVS
jgi:hypothetical protein